MPLSGHWHGSSRSSGAVEIEIADYHLTYGMAKKLDPVPPGEILLCLTLRRFGASNLQFGEETTPKPRG
jgi:hypothetical protein